MFVAVWLKLYSLILVVEEKIWCKATAVGMVVAWQLLLAEVKQPAPIAACIFGPEFVGKLCWAPLAALGEDQWCICEAPCECGSDWL